MRFFWLCLLAFSLTACGSLNLVPTQAPMLRLNDIHPLGATDVEFNHSGNMIATGGYLGEIYIWKIPEGKKLYTLKQHEHSVTGLIWVDDNTLLSASEDGQITLWDVTRHRHPGNGVKMRMLPYEKN